jgi:hypothetical protein
VSASGESGFDISGFQRHRKESIHIPDRRIVDFAIPDRAEFEEVVTWRREFTRASGFSISGFSVTRDS